MLNYQMLISCSCNSEGVQNVAQGTSGGSIDILHWCFLQDLHLSVLPEMLGLHLFFMKGQNIKERKSRGVPGVQWTGIHEQGVVKKGNIFQIAVVDLFSLPSSLFSIAVFV